MIHTWLVYSGELGGGLAVKSEQKPSALDGWSLDGL